MRTGQERLRSQFPERGREVIDNQADSTLDGALVIESITGVAE